MSQEHYHLSDVFKASTNSAGSFVVNRTGKSGQLKFWAGVSLKVTSTVELKKTKRMAATEQALNTRLAIILQSHDMICKQDEWS